MWNERRRNRKQEMKGRGMEVMKNRGDGGSRKRKGDKKK